EGGVGGTIRFLKNIAGLWLVQECRRAWERQGRAHTYDELTRLAAEGPPLRSLVDPGDASVWLPPGNPQAPGEFRRQTRPPAPAGVGPTVRCALESLVLRYRWVLEKLEALLGRKLTAIHVVGGGSQNALLCQLTADGCDRPVLAGPVEATAIGNVLVQAIGLGVLGSLAEAREGGRRSVEVRTDPPRGSGPWQA